METKMTDNKRKLRLEDISRRKELLLADIRYRQEKIGNYTRRISSPFFRASDRDSNSLVKTFNKGMAIFDGFLIGMKIIKSIRSTFTKKRR